MIETRRLRLREWKKGDLAAFADLNAHPEVMTHFPSTLDRQQSDALVGRFSEHLNRHGYGFWAVEIREGAPFVGFLGLSNVSFEAHFTPSVEIGWRLAREAWGKGYAQEAARAVLRHAFDVLKLREVVSSTVPANIRSFTLMERIGMKRNASDDFEHPNLPRGHPLRHHILYRLDARQWSRMGPSDPAKSQIGSGGTSVAQGQIDRHGGEESQQLDEGNQE
jgi:RimJ/RimL family protein N-acetyltransferase